MTKKIYIHIDPISNAVVSHGIHASDFVRGIVHQPKNLLLLDPVADYGEYDTHTGLKVLRGTEEVTAYFDEIYRKRQSSSLKWIDFTDIAMLKELTPLEISELLYFGHMKTHLHSPFFYKLQNNFVYFDFNEDMTRVYYRYMDEFYRILADKLTRIVLEKLNDRKTFFRKGVSVEKLDSDLLKDMRGILQEGVVFSFEQTELIDKEYRIPIYVVEDYLWKIKGSRYQEENLLATLIYQSNKRRWRLEKSHEDLLFAQYTR
ncbi:hypothetical protein [Enterococcus phoeniculicola]|jgi:hypothetical protein|uniref:Uncharacterized protein n=1 Tax=Enterococcus phoeniculicola ATCC BAA-412 TaxID=1158610 RepID=R3WMQ6_9ENTE|nr:hypothetical protein [Enterococcus phoeniculicola]EOL49136.1 hypothetical protein UC3_00231 [Enterococcus phoeniculicola ATCC BAA-412]EOT70949.1 hypothetical protein I589_03433 [Enterococcus phoeniculicola ATCC BAA-412]